MKPADTHVEVHIIAVIIAARLLLEEVCRNRFFFRTVTVFFFESGVFLRARVPGRVPFELLRRHGCAAARAGGHARDPGPAMPRDRADRSSPAPAAAEAVAKNEGEVDTISFTFDNFKQVYREELCGGKYWGVEHDVSKINGSGMKCVGAPAFEARFDYVYFTSNMKCTAVSMVLTDEQKDCIYDACTDVLPNSWHPSDHLPLRASFQFAA